MKKIILIKCLLLVAALPINAQEEGVQDRQKIKDQLFEAAENGDFETLKTLLTKYPDMKDIKKNGGWTLLHIARTSREMVEYLIKIGSDIEAKSSAQWTPLHSHAYYGHKDGVKLLLEHGADIEAKTFSGAGLPVESRLANGRIHLDEIAYCRTIIFAGSPHHSHHHPEGFNNWQKTHKNITFVYSFEDKLGRNPRYFKDVEGPKYIYLPDGEKKTIQGMKVETIPVVSAHGNPRGSGFLVEADGLVIFFGGKHLLRSESQREAFRKPIDTLKDRGIEIDLLILPGNFALGRIFPINLEGVEDAIKTLKPKAYLASGGDSTEFVLLEVAVTLEKYKDHTKIFCPEHRGDMFILRN